MKFQKQGAFYVANLGTLEVTVLSDLFDDTWRIQVGCTARTEAHSWLVQMYLTNIEYPTPEAAMAAAGIIFPPLRKQLSLLLKLAEEEGSGKGVPALSRIAEDDSV